MIFNKKIKNNSYSGKFNDISQAFISVGIDDNNCTQNALKNDNDGKIHVQKLK